MIRSKKSPPTSPPEALDRITPSKLAHYVGPLDFFAKEVAGGREQFVEGCKFSDNPKVQAIVRLNDERPKESLEDLCVEADIKPDELVGEATRSLFKWKRMWARWKNAQKLPDVMEASARAAMDPFGVEDRKMQFQIGGLMPMPGGPSVNIFNQPQMGGIPSFEEDIKGEEKVVEVEAEEGGSGDV